MGEMIDMGNMVGGAIGAGVGESLGRMERVGRAGRADRAREVAAIVSGANHSEVARRTGITLSHVNRVLNRKRTASTRKLQAIALALGLGLEELYAYLTYTQPTRPHRPHHRPRRGNGKAA